MLEEYLGTVSWSLQDLSSKVAALEDTLKRDAPAVDSPELGSAGAAEVRKTPSWPRSWANASLL